MKLSHFVRWSVAAAFFMPAVTANMQAAAQDAPCETVDPAASTLLNGLAMHVNDKDFKALAEYVRASWYEAGMNSFSRKTALEELGLLIKHSGQLEGLRMCTEEQGASGYYADDLTEAVDRITIRIDDEADLVSVSVRRSVEPQAVKPGRSDRLRARARQLHLSSG